jgi:hypothetical protein
MISMPEPVLRGNKGFYVTSQLARDIVSMAGNNERGKKKGGNYPPKFTTLLTFKLYELSNFLTF